jgi:hypothetical protein
VTFDLSTLDTVKASDEGSVLQVRHPTTGAVLANGDGRAVEIKLAGTDSERARKAERSALNRRLKMGGRRGAGTLTAEELDNDALEMLAVCTLAWSGFVMDGQEVECTPENAKRLYRQMPWLREQAQAHAEERSNFLKVSPTN